MILAVSEFRKTIIHRAGGATGRLSCFTEVAFPLQSGEGLKPEEIRPDGLIQAAWGKKQWAALVEVKVGRCALDEEQIDKYLRLARQERFDALITVSNQPAQADGRPPVKMNGHLLKSVAVVHCSWDRLLSEAQVLSRNKAVSDPDQAWMLDEWIRYIEDPESRIVVPPHLGRHWCEVLQAFQTGSPAANSPELQDVIAHWRGFLRKAALRLRAKLGVEVRVAATAGERKEAKKHLQQLAIDTCRSGALNGVLKVRDAAGPISVDIFLSSRCVRYALAVPAPTAGKQATRVKWLARQLRALREIPSSLQVTAEWTTKGLVSQGRAQEIADDPAQLQVDPTKVPIPKDLMPRRFVLQRKLPLAKSKGRSSGRVLEAIAEGLEDFYRDVVQGVKAYVPQVPRLPAEEEPEADLKSEESTATIEQQAVSEGVPPETPADEPLSPPASGQGSPDDPPA
jgi:hypothetical protein